MRKNCETCGEGFEARRRTAKYCSGKCRVQAQRGGGTAPVKALPPPEARFSEVGPLEEVTRSQLEAAGLLDGIEGAVVLTLARRIDLAGPLETGSAFAALTKEFRASLAAAMAGAEVANDPVDELRARRDAKRSG